MWPDRVSNPGPLAHESDALPTVVRGPAMTNRASNDEVRRKIQAAIGEHDELLTLFKKRKLRWFGNVPGILV